MTSECSNIFDNNTAVTYGTGSCVYRVKIESVDIENDIAQAVFMEATPPQYEGIPEPVDAKVFFGDGYCHMDFLPNQPMSLQLDYEAVFLAVINIEDDEPILYIIGRDYHEAKRESGVTIPYLALTPKYGSSGWGAPYFTESQPNPIVYEKTCVPVNPYTNPSTGKVVARGTKGGNDPVYFFLSPTGIKTIQPYMLPNMAEGLYVGFDENSLGVSPHEVINDGYSLQGAVINTTYQNRLTVSYHPPQLIGKEAGYSHDERGILIGGAALTDWDRWVDIPFTDNEFVYITRGDEVTQASRHIEAVSVEDHIVNMTKTIEGLGYSETVSYDFDDEITEVDTLFGYYVRPINNALPVAPSKIESSATTYSMSQTTGVLMEYGNKKFTCTASLSHESATIAYVRGYNVPVQINGRNLWDLHSVETGDPVASYDGPIGTQLQLPNTINFICTYSYNSNTLGSSLYSMTRTFDPEIDYISLDLSNIEVSCTESASKFGYIASDLAADIILFTQTSCDRIWDTEPADDPVRGDVYAQTDITITTDVKIYIKGEIETLFSRTWRVAGEDVSGGDVLYIHAAFRPHWTLVGTRNYHAAICDPRIEEYVSGYSNMGVDLFSVISEHHTRPKLNPNCDVYERWGNGVSPYIATDLHKSMAYIRVPELAAEEGEEGYGEYREYFYLDGVQQDLDTIKSMAGDSNIDFEL